MPQDRIHVHPLIIRINHWVGAYAMFCMILSGWQIYNASPILPFDFPQSVAVLGVTIPITLGGWLAAGIAWHFAAMWLLVVNGLVYLIYGISSGYFRRMMLPVKPGGVAREVGQALTFRLHHEPGIYNNTQRLLYLGVIVVAILTIATGLSIWKPVQFAPLTAFFGGYDIARRIHFALMVVICAFIVIHVLLVLFVPSTLLSMLVGSVSRRQTAQHPAREHSAREAQP